MSYKDSYLIYIFCVDCQITFDTQSIASALYAFTFAVELNEAKIWK